MLVEVLFRTTHFFGKLKIHGLSHLPLVEETAKDSWRRREAYMGCLLIEYFRLTLNSTRLNADHDGLRCRSIAFFSDAAYRNQNICFWKVACCAAAGDVVGNHGETSGQALFIPKVANQIHNLALVECGSSYIVLV